MNLGKILRLTFLSPVTRTRICRYSVQAAVEVQKGDDQQQQQVQGKKDDLPPKEYRQMFPEFLPNPRVDWRNKLREKLERSDMLKRRTQIEIPEFYVGSILAVVVSDIHAPNKTSRFLGLCTERGEFGLRAFFVLRNVIDHQGIEIRYDLYNPTIRRIEVIKLEKRLDDNLRYLRDCPQEYSTFPQDMEPEFLPDNAPVPVNELKVPLKPLPWSMKWQYWNLKGVLPETYLDVLALWQKKRFATTLYQHQRAAVSPYDKYDLMRAYRDSITEEDQREIFRDVRSQVGELSRAKTRRKKVLVRPKKTG